MLNIRFSFIALPVVFAYNIFKKRYEQIFNVLCFLLYHQRWPWPIISITCIP